MTSDDILNGMDFNGYNLYDYQLDGVRYGLNHHNFLLLDEQGLGKAQPYGSIVYTPNGVINIEELNVGDYVLGSNSRTKVIGIYDRGVLPIYKVTFNDGSSTLCSNDHLWTIYRRMNDDDAFTVDTNYLLENYKSGVYIPMIEMADFDDKYLPIDPYIMGVLLGNGSISSGAIGFSINKQDYSIKQNIDIALDDDYICKFHKCKSKNCIEYYIVNKDRDFRVGKYVYTVSDMQIGYFNDLYNYLLENNYIDYKLSTFRTRLCDYFNGRECGKLKNINIIRKRLDNNKCNMYKSYLVDMDLYGCDSKSKYIPDIYKYNSYNKRLKLLQGLIDTDGHISKDGVISYSSVSYRLLCDVKELAESFGAKVRFKQKKNYNVTAFGKEYVYTNPTEIILTFPDNFICCTSQRKVNRLHYNRNKKCYYKVMRKIVNIEYVGKKLCRCIKVENTDGLYATNDFIMTHNTLQIITLARYKKLHQSLKHCLIICGVNSLKFNWQREVEKFCKDERAVVLGTRVNSKGKVVSTTVEEMKQQIDNVPEEFFWVMNIERIRLNDEDKKAKDGVVHHFNKLIEAGELGMIVIDEVHKSKSITSSTAKGIMAFNSKASKVAMTGTLLVNNPLDLYCPMSFVGLINYNKWLFDKKFVIKDDWGRPVGYQNMDELHNILYRSSIRRTKDLLDLPEKLLKDEVLEFSTDEWKVMDDLMHGDYGGKYLDKIEPVFDTVAMITRMRQITVSTDLVSSTHFKSTKFDRLNDILEEAKINGQKVLVFCPFTQALELGLEYCKEYHPKLIKGGMGARVQEVIDEHENTEGFSCIFAQEATLGAGFTLVNTEIVVFLSPPWNRANYDQCCDRCHRIGQKHTVQVINLYIADTYDEEIRNMLSGKGAMSDIVIDADESSRALDYIERMGIVFHKKMLKGIILYFKN